MSQSLFEDCIPKVLIVDDSKENRLLIKLTLSQFAKYDFFEACNGEEGVELAIQEQPHIILMDAIMPVLNGFEAIRILRKNSLIKKTPIIMISAIDNKDDKVKVLQSGSSDFISKPFDKRELITRVNSLLTLNIQFLNKEKELEESNTKIKELHNYDVEQQYIAKEKLEIGIVNDINNEKTKVISVPFDILSGDYYSLYQLEDGSRFIYIIDGQGHGVSPALTVFAVSSSIKNLIYNVNSLEELASKLFPMIKKFLGEIEQISYTLIMISSDSSKLSYISGGMYPFLIKTGEKITRVKANNLPFMDYSPMPLVNVMEIENWESMLLYSDGLVEHNSDKTDSITPNDIINGVTILDDVVEEIRKLELEDDVTMIYIENGN
jgi:CheY-like chemotaxis protein